MLNGINTEFSIRDLENLSGVKAHTIRIWEKRYNLLEPKRTNSNIRLYDINGLRKLLNTSWLLQNGHKISKVAVMSEEELQLSIREAASAENSNDQIKNELKLAMLNFDEKAFSEVLNNLGKEKTFREIFIDVFVSFLADVGTWWLTDVIRPAHEHFVSNLIRQKLFANIEKASSMPPVTEDELYVLFTPINEIHELGLLYVHYELLLRGKRSVYLGQSVPINDISLVDKGNSKCTYICAMTVKPETDHLEYYMQELHQKLVQGPTDQLVFFGRKIDVSSTVSNLVQTSLFPNFSDYIENL